VDYAVAYQLLDDAGAPTPAGAALAAQLAAAEAAGRAGEAVVLPVLLASSGEGAIADFSQGGERGGVFERAQLASLLAHGMLACVCVCLCSLPAR
jgi:hypothetical protein